jgi:hypothetical protein
MVRSDRVFLQRRRAFGPAVFLLAGLAAGSCEYMPPPSRSQGLGTESVEAAPYDQFLSEVLPQTGGGRRLRELYMAYGSELQATVANSAGLTKTASTVDAEWKPVVQALVDGRGSTVTVTDKMWTDLVALAEGIKTAGRGQIPAVVQAMENAIGLSNVVGAGSLKADVALTRYQLAIDTATIPVVASIHGAGGSFFHSDVTVFNASGITSADVTATYRCFSGSCGAATQSFKLAPREMRSFDDAAVTLFGAAESGGAIEFVSTGSIVVNSRLYTPSSPAPSVGMSVAGLRPEEAFPTVALPSLSYSRDSSRGFRTNVGVYNGNDMAVTVDFALFTPRGDPLGHTAHVVGARQAYQVNDVFGTIGIATDVPDAYGIVTGDGIHPLFAYASVVDNVSQDLTLIQGANGIPAGPVSVTLPVAASLHGVSPTFFHSDVRILNVSTSASTAIQALYHCFSGACGDADQILVIPPRQELVLDDIIASLFHAPETGGAVDFSGGPGAVVTSRLYTPSKPGPTVGQLVPGVAAVDPPTIAVITSLSGSSNPGRGFRSNVGAFNLGTGTLALTFSLYRADGELLGTANRNLRSRQAVQINDIFAAVGAAGDLSSAYCIVTGGGNTGFLSYASVVDNQSQDPALVQGRSLTTP